MKQDDKEAEDRWLSVDDVLHLWVRLSEFGVRRIGVTLFVGGVVVAGDVIPTWEFRQRLTALHRATIRPETPGANIMNELWDRFDEATEEIKTSAVEPEEQNDSRDIAPRRYICLENVRVFMGNEAPIRAPMWRIRLAAVDGWTPGVADIA